DSGFRTVGQDFTMVGSLSQDGGYRACGGFRPGISSNSSKTADRRFSPGDELVLVSGWTCLGPPPEGATPVPARWRSGRTHLCSSFPPATSEPLLSTRRVLSRAGGI